MRTLFLGKTYHLPKGFWEKLNDYEEFDILKYRNLKNSNTNSKSEARNSKQIRILKFECSKLFGISVIGFLRLFRISIFEFRI